MHAALNLVEQGEFAEARQHYAKALELAIRSDEADLTVQARLQLARALGEEACFQQAVQHIAAAVEDLQQAEAKRLARKELWAQLCHAGRVQASWLAHGGDASQAAAILEELLDDPRTGEDERCRTELDRIGLVALVDRPGPYPSISGWPPRSKRPGLTPSFLLQHGLLLSTSPSKNGRASRRCGPSRLWTGNTSKQLSCDWSMLDNWTFRGSPQRSWRLRDDSPGVNVPHWRGRSFHSTGAQASSDFFQTSPPRWRTNPCP
ncbi:hypothetical protein SAMN04487912_105124 [Arthrobacter sp. cf158]|nr:hypothetical protein SAMN04487912_105124 [Arthrobacter sp. cf158]